jgi:hypothetical protein
MTWARVSRETLNGGRVLIDPRDGSTVPMKLDDEERYFRSSDNGVTFALGGTTCPLALHPRNPAAIFGNQELGVPAFRISRDAGVIAYGYATAILCDITVCLVRLRPEFAEFAGVCLVVPFRGLTRSLRTGGGWYVAL